LEFFTLNENVASYFLENEQAAFAPSRMVPGIEPSAERMLQWRLYSYPDTQNYRLGVNNQMLPVNKPKCPFMDNHQNGEMNFNNPEPPNPINYFPSTMSGDTLSPAYPHDPILVLQGAKVRVDIDDNNDFGQPGQRYASWDSARQGRFAMRVASTLSGKLVTSTVLNRWLDYWNNVNTTLASNIKMYLNELKEDEYSPLHEFKRDFLKTHGSVL